MRTLLIVSLCLAFSIIVSSIPQKRIWPFKSSKCNCEKFMKKIKKVYSYGQLTSVTLGMTCEHTLGYLPMMGSLCWKLEENGDKLMELLKENQSVETICSSVNVCGGNQLQTTTESDVSQENEETQKPEKTEKPQISDKPDEPEKPHHSEEKPEAEENQKSH